MVFECEAEHAKVDERYCRARVDEMKDRNAPDYIVRRLKEECRALKREESHLKERAENLRDRARNVSRR